MRAVFYSFRKQREPKEQNFRRLGNFSFSVFFKKYGLASFFAVSLILGMAFGSVYAQSAGENIYNGLDFLFTTNLEARLSQNFIGTFCACFASNFIFVLAVFLLGITPWGIPFIPLVCMFKGFGGGLSGGFLFAAYSFKGLLFYLVILLPGLFVFSLALISQSCMAFYMSKRIFHVLFIKDQNPIPMHAGMLFYLQRSLLMLLAALACAVLDTLLWCAFAPMFAF